MSKRAIICPCGLAKPCEKSDCRHSTAIALRADFTKGCYCDVSIANPQECRDAGKCLMKEAS